MTANIDTTFLDNLHDDRSKRGSAYKTRNGQILSVIQPMESGDVVCVTPSGEFHVIRWGRLQKYEYLGWGNLGITIEHGAVYPAGDA